MGSKPRWGYMFYPLGFLFALWAGSQYLFNEGFRINWTRSMPLGLYKLVAPNAPFRAGDIVEFCPPGWVNPETFSFYPTGRCASGGEPMLKKVVATAGDVVDATDSGVLINGTPLQNSYPLIRPGLPRLRGRFELSSNEIWVFGSGSSPELARHSFDSRYFGPVQARSVTGVQTRN